MTRDDVVGNKSLQQDILNCINEKRSISRDYVSKKREVFTKWKDKYLNKEQIASNSDMVRVNLVHQQKKSFISTFIQEGLSAEFDPEEYGDDEIAYKMNKIASSRVTKMGKNKKDFITADNLFTYGVDIRVRT